MSSIDDADDMKASRYSENLSMEPDVEQSRDINMLSVEIGINTGEETRQSRTPDPKLPHVVFRVPNTAFGISMGVAGQAIMWKSASDAAPFIDNIHANVANYIFWVAGLVVAILLAIGYTYKLITRFDFVRAEYLDPARSHFMNCPHVTMILLAIGVPPSIQTSSTSLRVIWWIGFVVQICLTERVYEKWMFSKTRNISLAQPHFLLSTVGWFLLAVLGQQANIDESVGLGLTAYCFGAGMVLYFMVVIAVFNRLHVTPQAKGSPALTLLIAPPAIGVVALLGFDANAFNTVAEMWLGWCLVLVLLLARLGPMIAGRPPALGTYWAYVFPLSALANATIQNATINTGKGAEIMAIFFLAVAVLALVVVFCRGCIHTRQCMIGKDQWSTLR